MDAPDTLLPTVVLPAMDVTPGCPMARLDGFLVRASATVEAICDEVLEIVNGEKHEREEDERDELRELRRIARRIDPTREG